MKQAKSGAVPTLTPDELDRLPFVDTVKRLEKLLGVLGDRIDRARKRRSKLGEAELNCVRVAANLVPMIQGIQELLEETEPEAIAV
jgi:hypothetical protein